VTTLGRPACGRAGGVRGSHEWGLAPVPHIGDAVTHGIVGLGFFSGGWTRRLRGINGFSANDDDVLSEFTYVENGLAPIRDLDHVYAKLRYAF